MREPLFRDRELEMRLDSFAERLADVLGHADRTGPFASYLSGLLGDGERKSVEPIAMRSAPARVSAQHQSLLHLVGQSPWSDADVLRAIREYAFPAIEASGPIDAWIVDDTGMVKKGTHSVGVARQYCGRLGKQENCQVAVSLSVANERASLPIAYRLYLPEVWAEDAERCQRVRVPEEIVFQTKPEIALDQIRQAVEEGIRPGVVLADAGYGDVTAFRDGITELGLRYVVGIKPGTAVWTEGTGPLPPKRYSGRGARPHRLRRDAEHQPVSVREVALGLATNRYRTLTWREGTARPLRSRFAAVQVRPSHLDRKRDAPRELEWLLIEWPIGESEPTKYSLSTLAKNTPLRRLVYFNKSRWRIERDYEELKGELGLHHYEGRGWRGFHHHATLCIAAYAFLAAERGRFPPEGARSLARITKPPLPKGLRPRGSPGPTRKTQPGLNRHHSTHAGGTPRRTTTQMSHVPPAQPSPRKPRPKS